MSFAGGRCCFLICHLLKTSSEELMK
uniref:Uncharacterized protein n=1 Tax=Arundo donax TaxID=35708 RepID=A0A0A9ANC1_ARUDO